MSGVHVSVVAGGEHYALPVDGVLEIAELGDVTPVPGAPPAVLGVRNLRGQVIPVVDLAALLGLDNHAATERVVVIEHDGRCAALAVDSVSDVGKVGDPTDAVESPYLRGAVFVGDALVGVMDLGVMLAALAPQAAP